jgi:hypothetical protein
MRIKGNGNIFLITAKEFKMNNSFGKVFFIMIILFSADRYLLFAQGPAITGHIETTYNYYFGDTTMNMLRSYDALSNQILLNNVHIALNGSPSEKVSYTAELDFGTDAAVHGLLHVPGIDIGPGAAVDVQEAYITYAFSDNVKFTGGKFVTFEGIEVIEGPANPTISRGYLFGLAEAFTHVGGYFTFIVSNAFDFKIGIVNGWDVLVDNNKDKTVIGRAGVNLGNPLALGASFSWGVEQGEPSDDARTSLDLTGVTKVIPRVALNFQVNYGSETIDSIDASWVGFGVQPVISLSDHVDLGARVEYFADNDGVRTLGIPDFNSLNITLVPTFKYDSFTFRIEYRLDSASDEIFPVSEEDPSKTSSTISLGVSCSF